MDTTQYWKAYILEVEMLSVFLILFSKCSRILKQFLFLDQSFFTFFCNLMLNIGNLAAAAQYTSQSLGKTRLPGLTSTSACSCGTCCRLRDRGDCFVDLKHTQKQLHIKVWQKKKEEREKEWKRTIFVFKRSPRNLC